MIELATDKQKAVLYKNGYKPEQVKDMPKREAHKIISDIFAKSERPKDVTSRYPAITSAEVPTAHNKDRLIVRQSCLKAAVECISEKIKETTDKTDLAKAVLITAEEFEKWVFR